MKNYKMLMGSTFLHYKMLMEIYRGGRKNENVDLRYFMLKKSDRLYGNIGVSEEGIITLPLYMVAFI